MRADTCTKCNDQDKILSTSSDIMIINKRTETYKAGLQALTHAMGQNLTTGHKTSRAPRGHNSHY